MDLQRNIQDLRDQARRENTEIRQSPEGIKSRLDEVQETINKIEMREQEYREAEAERVKGSLGIKEY